MKIMVKLIGKYMLTWSKLLTQKGEEKKTYNCELSHCIVELSSNSGEFEEEKYLEDLLQYTM